ncbi:MAG: GntR family transcriptional regulator [Victivallales bacterium]
MLSRILKTEAVKEELLRQIESKDLKEGDRICSEKELENICEVSRITVRRAISQLSSEGRVLSVNGRGTFVGSKAGLLNHSGRRDKTIEFVTPANLGGGADGTWGSMTVLAEIESGIKKSTGYKLVFSNTHGDVSLERKVIEDAISGTSAAIVFQPVFTSTAHLLEKHVGLLVRSGKIIVVSERLVPFEVNNIYEDDSHGAWLATSHLIRNGHRSILHMNFSGDYLENRRKGYKKALIENNIPVREGLIYGRRLEVKDDMYVLEYDDFFELGYRAAKKTMEKEKFTAIFAVNDMAAFGAIKALEEIGLKVPEDVSIVGYDNHPDAEKNNLTSVERPFSEMGKVIAETIAEKIREKDQSSVTRIGVKPRLVERGSVVNIH